MAVLVVIVIGRLDLVFDKFCRKPFYVIWRRLFSRSKLYLCYLHFMPRRVPLKKCVVCVCVCACGVCVCVSVGCRVALYDCDVLCHAVFRS